MGANIHCECGRKNILSSILIMEVMEVIESEDEFNIAVGNLFEEGQVGVNTYGSPIAAQERAQDFVRGGEVLAATDENVRVVSTMRICVLFQQYPSLLFCFIE